MFPQKIWARQPLETEKQPSFGKIGRRPNRSAPAIVRPAKSSSTRLKLGRFSLPPLPYPPVVGPRRVSRPPLHCKDCTHSEMNFKKRERTRPRGHETTNMPGKLRQKKPTIQRSPVGNSKATSCTLALQRPPLQPAGVPAPPPPSSRPKPAASSCKAAPFHG